MGCSSMSQINCSNTTDEKASNESSKLTINAAASDERNTRHVRFSSKADIITYLPSRNQMNPAQRDALWWRRRDFHGMVTEASRCAEEAGKNKTLVGTIEHALREARRAAALDQPSSAPEIDCLRLWCQYGHNRRGLEKLVSHLHQTSRDNVVSKHRTKVVSLSRLGASVEIIRTTSEKYSRPSIIFARMMGLADAEAVLRLSPPAQRKLQLACSPSPSLPGKPHFL